MVLLLFALHTSDRVVTRTPLHLLYDFLFELLSSRLSYFIQVSIPDLGNTIYSVSSTIFFTVMKFVLDLAALLRSIIYVFATKIFPDKVSALRNVRSPFSAARFILSSVLRSLRGILEGLTWFSEGNDVFIICHSASLLWLKFLGGLVCTHPVLLVFDISGLVNPQFSITAEWASAP